jgi:hypothetical protein
MPACTCCDWCPGHEGTTEPHRIVLRGGCVTSPGPGLPPAGCNGTYQADHVTGEIRLVHLNGPCPSPKHQ